MTQKRSLVTLSLVCALLCVLLTLCVVTVGAEDGAVFAPVTYGTRGGTVEEIQQKLKELGYYTGKVSGNYLDGRREAVPEGLRPAGDRRGG